MASGKTPLGGLLGRFLFKAAGVVEKKQLSAHFLSLRVRGGELRGARWVPGDKVQIFVPGAGMRTYTPLSWDAEGGATEFLIYAHGSGPGATWARSIGEGESLQLFGPRRSLVVPETGRTVLFGDETSFGVAHALGRRRPSVPLRCVFEVSERREAEAVLSAYGLAGASLVERTQDDAHLEDAHERIRGLLDGGAGAELVMTGRAQAISALRKRMKGEGLKRPAEVKAYWSLGKRGLD